MSKPRPFRPWEVDARGLASRDELKAARAAKKAKVKAYDAVRRAFRVANRLCTSCGVALPADRKLKTCAEHTKGGRTKRTKYS